MSTAVGGVGLNMRFGIMVHTLLSLLIHAVTADWHTKRKARSPKRR